MGRKLTDVDVQFLSLVKKGANGEKVTVYKSADFEETQEITEETQETPEETITTSGNLVIKAEEVGTLKKMIEGLKNIFGGVEKEDTVVEKAKDINTEVDYTSFSSRMNDVYDNWWKACDTLRSVGNSVFWSDKDNGKDLILKSVDEFKGHVSKLLNTKVQKEDVEAYFTEPEEPVVVAKTNTLEALKVIRDSLNDSIGSLENLEKGVDEQVKTEEIQAMLTPITKSIEDLTAKVSALEKVEEKVDEVQKSAEETETKVEETSEGLKEFQKALEPIVKSLEGIGQRLTAMEETRGVSKQGDTTEVEKGEKDDWEGVLFNPHVDVEEYND